jgi:hypothetical protein
MPHETGLAARITRKTRADLKAMNTWQRLFTFTCSCGAVLALSAADPSFLDPHLEPLRPMLEKTWKGAFANSKPDKPTVDVMRWERALNGKAVRVLHSVNDGAYGGETLIRWDDQKQAVCYHYFTTAGFMTTGTMRFQDGKVLTHEVVTGSPSGGTTEVRGTSELRPGSEFHVKTEHRKQGAWAPGREVTYQEAPSATVRFR